MKIQSYFSSLESFVILLFVFSIPIQSRLILHSWTTLFNEWASAFLYGTDILLIVLFSLWISRIGIRELCRLFFKEKLFLLFYLSATVSVLNSEILAISAFRLIKLFEFLLLYVYFRNNFGKMFNIENLSISLVASGVFQSLVGAAQYFLKSSLGLRFLGEGPLSVNIYNVAVFSVDNTEYLRAYGTTPHPNVLAAFLFISIFAFYYIYTKSKSRFKNYSLVFYVVLLLGFFLTFSRVAIFFLLFATIFVFIMNFHRSGGLARSGLKKLLLVTSLFLIIFSIVFWPQVKSRARISSQEEAVTDRIFYNNIAISLAASRPIIGSGIGQFVVDLMSKYKHYPSRVYQPVHNVYLLIWAEVGTLGLVAFFVLIVSVFRKSILSFLSLDRTLGLSITTLGLAFLSMALFDHFLLTIQQGNLVFWPLLAMVSIIGSGAEIA